MDVATTLEEALAKQDWSVLSHTLDEAFFRLVCENFDLVIKVFETVPAEFYLSHPRHANSRALVAAMRSSLVVMDRAPAEDFAQWVAEQENPALRDILGVLSAKARLLASRRMYKSASDTCEHILELVQNSQLSDEGLHDVVPALLVQAGVVKLLANDTNRASSCFAEALRWSRAGSDHPFGKFAAGHLALVHALEQRFNDASEVLDDSAARFRWHSGHLPAYDFPEAVARVLVEAGSLHLQAAQGSLRRLLNSLVDGDLWWTLLHARAQVALLEDNPWPAIHALSTWLMENSARGGMGSLCTSLLLADLGSLYQSAGDLREASRILADPALDEASAPVVVARARQMLIIGRPQEAMKMLRRTTTSGMSDPAARFTASGALLFASAEIAASGSISKCTLEHAATVVDHHGALDALMAASASLRNLLFPALGVDACRIPEPWQYREAFKLTPREQEVLKALREHPTVNLVAVALHVSPNTAKTHVRALYRKLGVHSRKEALWVASQHEHHAGG